MSSDSFQSKCICFTGIGLILFYAVDSVQLTFGLQFTFEQEIRYTLEILVILFTDVLFLFHFFQFTDDNVADIFIDTGFDYLVKRPVQELVHLVITLRNKPT